MDEELADPGDDELIRFAARLLGSDEPLADHELLRDTIRDARPLWLLLYRASQDTHRPQPPPN